MFLLLWIFFAFQTMLHFSRGDLIVQTESGLIKGKKATTVDQGKPYYSFQGIPYAKPPLGDLRFKAPIPNEPWIGVRSATSEGNICFQRFNQGSEDCLYINVYTPVCMTTTLHNMRSVVFTEKTGWVGKVATLRNNMSDSLHLLPVMVWIYGGAFIHGDSTYTSYGPDYFLDEEVVFVSMNYRLGILGFFSTEDEVAYGNWGLKDQLLALKWVQTNIGNFGGNKNNVTIFGESAGAVSVSLLVQSQLAEGLFHKAIMQSGCSLNLWGLTRHPRNVSFATGAILGINIDNSTVLTNKLREMDAGQLWLASTAVSAGGTLKTVSLSGLTFAPSKEPEHKDAVVVGLSHENLKNGLFHKIPVIIGFNSQEGLMLSGIMGLVKQYLLSFNLLPDELIPVDLNLSDPELVSNISNAISARYFGDHLEALTNENLVQYVTDDQFVRPINEAARLMSKWAPVFHYRFAFIESGVGHGEELQYMFTSSENINDSDSNNLIRQRILKLWTNFAKTPFPVPQPDLLLDNIDWKIYSEEETFLDFGTSLSMSSNTERYNIPWWKSIFDTYGNPPFDTY